MNFDEQIEAIFEEITTEVESIIPQGYSLRKHTEPQLMALVQKLSLAISAAEHRNDFGSYSGYLIDIRESVRELCKPKTRFYQGDDFHVVTILSAFARLRHPMCLNLGSKTK